MSRAESGVPGASRPADPVTGTATGRGRGNALPKGLRNVLCLDDFEAEARRHVPRSIFAYVYHGVEGEVTLRDNRAAFNDYQLVPRVLVGVAKRSQKTTLFGRTYDSPFGVAPMGMESLIGYRGDLMIAQACHKANIPFIQSGASLIRLETLREQAPSAWFQAYVPSTFESMAALMDRCSAAGVETLVVTVDMTAGSNRENVKRAGFADAFKPNWHTFWEGATHPTWAIGTFLRSLKTDGVPHFENINGTRGGSLLKGESGGRDKSGRPGHNWDFFRRIREHWKGNLVIKGLLDPRDVKIAVDIGVDGVIVSTHGGRQIDGVIPSLRALPACVKAAGDVPVLLDSGVRRGTDVLKALALGAKFVFLGRPFNYSSIFGEAGPAHAISLLRAEVSRDMGNMGINSIAEMTRERIIRRDEELRYEA